MIADAGTGWAKLNRAAFIVSLAACVTLILMFPADAPWTSDGPRIILAARKANLDHRLGEQPLVGNFGAKYSPAPVWFYQGLLLISPNPVTLTILKTSLSVAATVAGLLFIAGKLRLPLWPILFALLPLYLFVQSRAIWDNNLLIPLSIWLWCFTLSLWSGGGRWNLPAALAVAVAMVHVHPMALAGIVPWVAAVLIFSWRWLKQNRRFAAGSLLCAAIVCAPFLYALIMQPKTLSSLPSLPWMTGRSVQLALNGPTLFKGSTLPEQIDFATPRQRLILKGLTHCTRLAGVAILAGALWSALMVYRKWKSRASFSLPEQAAVLGWLSVASAVACFFLLRLLPDNIHYLHPIWFAYFLFAWLSIAAGLRWVPVLTRLLAIAHGAALTVLLVMFVSFVHTRQGTRSPSYGPTLGNQMAVVKTLHQYAPTSKLKLLASNYAKFPGEFWSLVALLPQPAPDTNRPVRELRVRYSDDLRDARLYVEAVPIPPPSPAPQ